MTNEAYANAARDLYQAYLVGSGASRGCGRILYSLHQSNGDSAIVLDDLYRLDSAHLSAALKLIEGRIRCHFDKIPLNREAISQLQQRFEAA